MKTLPVVTFVRHGVGHNRFRYANGSFDPGRSDFWLFKLNVPSWYIDDRHIEGLLNLFEIDEHRSSGSGSSFATVRWELGEHKLLITRDLSFDV